MNGTRLLVLGFVCLAVAAFSPNDGFQRERNGKTDAAKNALEGAAPPPLKGEWLNVQSRMDWSNLKGKVVVLDFWAHWCGPCRVSMPKVKKLVDAYGSKGLVFVAVHSDPNRAKMEEAIRDLGMTWPVLFDASKEVMKSFGADSYPDYYLIDRKGNVRFADLANAEVERAVEMLIAEAP